MTRQSRNPRNFISKTRVLRAAILTAATCGATPTIARAQSVWTGGSSWGPSWNDAENWTGGVPFGNTTAIVGNSGQQPRLDSNISIGTVNFTGTYLYNNSGGATLTVNSQLTIDSATNNQFDSVNIVNAGNGFWNSGDIITSFAPTFSNTGTMSVQCDQSWNWFFFPPAQLLNSGLFQKVNSSGTTYIAADLSNSGTISAGTGTLEFVSPGPTRPVNTGTFLASSGATLRLSALNFDTGANFAGAGAMQLFNGNSIVGTTSVRSGNLSVVGTSNVLSGTVAISNGAVFELAVGGDLSGNGVIRGSGILGNTGEFRFSGGDLKGATGVGNDALTSTGEMHITGVENKFISDGRFTNAGHAVWDAGDIYTNFSPTINNTGVMDLQSDNFMFPFFYPPATINNSGTWKKTAGDHLSYISADFNNTGTVQADSGTLQIVATNGPSSSGTFISNGDAHVRLSGQNFQTGAHFTGTGTSQWDSSNTVVGLTHITAGAVQVVGAGNTISGTVSISSGGILDLAGSGQIKGNGRIEGGGTFLFTGGELIGDDSMGDGSLVNTTNMRITTSSAKYFSNGRFTNAGSAVWDQGTIYTNFSPTINNSGTMDIQSDDSLVPFFYPPATINNTGVWKKTAGDEQSSISAMFSNSGTVRADSGTLSINANGAGSNGTFISNGGGHVRMSSATFTTGANFRGTGVNQIDAGNSITGTVGIIDGTTQVVGASNALTGSVSIASGATLELALGGELSGNGSISGAGMFRFTGGTIVGDTNGGSLTNSADMLITGADYKALGAGSFQNTGNAVWDGGTIYTNYGPTFFNAGTMDLRSDDAIVPFFYPPATINNSGTWKKTAGAETSFVNEDFDSTGTILIASGAMSFGGPFSSTGTFTLNAGCDASFNGATSTFGGVQNWPAGYALTMNQNTNLNSDAGYAGPKLKLTHIGGNLNMTTTQHLQALNLISASATLSAGGSKIISTQSLNVDSFSTLDLSDNAMLVDYAVDDPSPRSTIESQVRHARNGSAWDQTGITSSSARAEAHHATTFAVLSGPEWFSLKGIVPFVGQAVDNTSVLLKYTYLGDANVNGKIDGGDYARIDVTYGLEGSSGSIGGWINGDFNYDGKVNGSDYALIDLGFAVQGDQIARAMSFLDGDDTSAGGMDTSEMQMIVLHLGHFGSDYANTFMTAVPEPTSGVVALATMGMLAKRRRRTMPDA